MWAASNFEFRYRFWIFGALFWISFALYQVERRPNAAGAALVDWVAGLRGVPATDGGYHVIFAVGGLFCIAAAALRTWGTAYLNPEVMVDGQLHTSRLVADGPYRYVRNPLYLGNILLAIGFGLLASKVGFCILVLGMIVFDYRLILREESEITAKQGDSYRAYCNAVPRLLPALLPRLPSAGRAADWRGGFLGEAFMWMLAASVIVFAATLNQLVFFVVVISSFVVYALCMVAIRKRQKKDAPSVP
jgi:hypothetical protein